MIAKLIISEVADDDHARPFRLQAFNEHEQFCWQCRYIESYEAVQAARYAVVQGYCPNATIVNRLEVLR